jgi:transposase
MCGKPTFIFLDNLKAHYSRVVLETADKCNQTLLYNGPYSSELQPIEVLWSFAKRTFRKEITKITDFKDTQQLIYVVEDCINSVPSWYLSRYTQRCIYLM